MKNETTYQTIELNKLLGSEPATIYFIGIGGIGMSALARYFHSKGAKVSGYDRTPTALTYELEREGIAIHYQEDVNAIPKDAALVVYTPAVPEAHAELQFFRNNNYPVVKRSDVLQAISAHSFNICVAGTHGKTSITTMIAHILRHSGYGGTAFLGGISVNYHTNYWSLTPAADAAQQNVTVIEADEYDRSFLKLSPNIAVISAMDADHLDIYGTLENMQDAFVAFGNRVGPEGILISKFGLKRVREMQAGKKLSYSLQNDAADIYGCNIQIEEGGYSFDVQLHDQMIAALKLRIGGMHNVENAIAAIAVAGLLKIDAEKISAALADFKGVKRRFEYILPPKKQEPGGYVFPVLIDDYAHHPEELRALLTSVRALFPQRIITVVFQPHLYTRTRDLAQGFAESLSLADRVILLPIYPARELPIEGVSSEMILKKIGIKEKQLLSRDELLQWMQNHVQDLNKEFGEVVVMAGAGDIDMLVEPVKQILEKA